MYWEQAGQHNTDATIRLALDRMQQNEITDLVVASCTGNTIKKILDLDISVPNLVCVTHHTGFADPGQNEMDNTTRQYLLDKGVKVLTTTHLLAGVDRAIRNQFGGVYPAEIMAQTLRLFGQGIKVAVEIAIMALDAGLVPFSKEIISIGGSASGVDAAIIIEPAHSNHFFDTQIKEIICMPRHKHRV